MQSLITRAFGFTLALFANLLLTTAVNAQPQERPLRPSPSQGIPVIPYMEGWYNNGDGSVTVSFGYHNRNQGTVYIPRGEDNRLEPAELDNLQPEIFFPGRHTGVFGVTLPASMADSEAWWHLSSGGEDLKVPGGSGSSAYELDRRPRPQGSVQPHIWFSDETIGSGPEGVVARQTLTVAAGAPLTLEVWTDDPSGRDRTDPRFVKPLDTRVIWYAHQGPGQVSFSEHDSTPFDTSPAYALLGLIPTADSRIAVPEGKGPARVVATFAEPGDYVIRARLDNWQASDSHGLDQCCWSNAFQRVRVTP